MAERKVAIGQRTMDRLRAGVRESAAEKDTQVDVEMAAQIIRAAMHGLASLLITTSQCYPWKEPERMKDETIHGTPAIRVDYYFFASPVYSVRIFKASKFTAYAFTCENLYCENLDFENKGAALGDHNSLRSTKLDSGRREAR